MDKITINDIEFTEKEIEAIEKEYNDLLQEVVHIEMNTGLDMHGIILGGAKKDNEYVTQKGLDYIKDIIKED